MNMRHASLLSSPPERIQRTRVGVFLPPEFPLAPLALVLEALRMANSMDDDHAFSHALISADGAPIQSSCGLPFPVHHSIKESPDYDVVLICAGSNSVDIEDRNVLSWLRRLHSHGVRLAAISSGAFVLAHAGLLNGLSCAVHWESARALSERFAKIKVTQDIFCVDSRIITCAGGMSTLDLMLHLIAEFRGSYLARIVADKLIYQAIRCGHEPARLDLSTRAGSGNPLLLRAIAIMEQTLGEPLTIGAISAKLGTSARHLERLFLRSLNMSPATHYMMLRLNEARNLLMQTDIPILEVAICCGFHSGSHFTKRYRRVFNTNPSGHRRQRLRVSASTHAPV
jgi:transcriptional regulator GlxA family with amidase domain